MTTHQKIVLDIYIFFSKVCKREGFSHWVTGGTVLGAVRHQGFIPWDDDMDVAMKRNELEVLVSNFNALFPDYYKLYWIERSQSYRIIDERYDVKVTKNFEGLFEPEQAPKIFIDLQAFDGAGSNKIASLIHSSRVIWWRSCYKIKDKDRLFKGKLVEL